MKKLFVNPDIRKAHTLPGSFYHDPDLYEKSKGRIFSAFWMYLTDKFGMEKAGKVRPLNLLPAFLDEPLLVTRDTAGALHLLSNVCTHRGKILVEKEGMHRILSCAYHGRCFYPDGRFKSMPGFEQAENFPTEADHLPAISLESFWGMLFGALNPVVPFSEAVAPIRERLAFLPLDRTRFVPDQSKDFDVDAHWALYVENYLEGFHIPWVHPALHQALEGDAYAYETFSYCNLQLGIAEEGQPCFPIPEGHPDFGKRVYAYYFWLFPNLMFNVYPWGLSLNVVEPRALDKTRVRFRTYLFENAVGQDRELNRIDETEYEDEAVVESVQLGTRSRLYDRGRFSPTMEVCVHHFHRLLAQYLEE
jgi:choline monooxygenase